MKKVQAIFSTFLKINFMALKKKKIKENVYSNWKH